TIKRITGLEGERKENSPVDCFPRESYAKLELIILRSKRGRRFRNNKGMLSAPHFKGVPLGTPLKNIYTIKQITGLEGERKENSPVDCFPRESYAKLELITRRSKRGRRFRNNKGMLSAPKQNRPKGRFRIN
ncbi:MAG: hypothetical protein VZQ55_09375, partial [Ruminococcus sp.]|nr:hypothetical protein [Ruminococcus sp.]